MAQRASDAAISDDSRSVWWVARVTASPPGTGMVGEIESITTRVAVRLERREKRGTCVECYFPQASTETVCVNPNALREHRPSALPTIEHARNLQDVREFVLSLA